MRTYRKAPARISSTSLVRSSTGPQKDGPKGPALLCFDGQFSIESVEITAVMHAEGEWHRRATASGDMLRAHFFDAAFDPMQSTAATTC